ncbi:MAG TPA: helix-turn-helix domain-containing protein [Acidimicrobiales bacterium]|jgi:AcrR family transcriptional regulator|nr:helix-turn-helix domain-containing protein [Acidimicrobiales bacterium]
MGRSLRAEQVQQTRGALIAAGRRLFGQRGFAGTSVEDLAHQARVTTGALYHHFPTKRALFEEVVEELHRELSAASTAAAEEEDDPIEALSRGVEAFLDAVLQPAVQQVLVTDAPAVLGMARSIELDERHAVTAVEAALRRAAGAGRLDIDDPAVLAPLLLGALTRGAMLIAGAADPTTTRDAVARGIRGLLRGLRPAP